MNILMINGPFDGQTKNVKQRMTAMGKPIPLAEKLSWPTPNHKLYTYVKVTDAKNGAPAHYQYQET